ncbi:MAG: hypothetical protein A4E19_19840 [Nitrospira sp. SG-bin1]|nr:MAG: hypothetical protein A4E19_19840 [Nitrospira sp. SG-bin1]
MLCSIVGGWAFLGDAGHAGSKDNPGVSKGESSQQSGQQGLGLSGAASSPILAGPEIIIGAIKKIQGEEYTIEGDRGQQIHLRVTKDTNKVCPSSDQAHVSSGQEGVRERTEIPPTASMQQSSKNHEQAAKAGERDRKDLEQHALAPPTQDPSHLQATVGSTDPRAKEDVARGSGFQIGHCAFKEGDQVRVEASDMGTATTIKQLLSSRSGQ